MDDRYEVGDRVVCVKNFHDDVYAGQKGIITCTKATYPPLV